MKILAADSVQARAVEQLGLDPSVLNLTSSEAIAATLRRVASFSCPCSAAHLVATAFEILSIVVGAILTREVINDSLEALISFGDLFESEDVTGRSSSQLVYL